jgi:DNA helicase HerA-like ATPase
MVQSQNLLEEGKIFLGTSPAGAETLELKLANRHGLVTGATGTGKTVSLQVMAEGFSAAGVPIFAADIKGDLSGISAMGEQKEGLVKRAKEIGLEDWSNSSRRCSGICSASRAIPSGPRCRRWGRCSCRA